MFLLASWGVLVVRPLLVKVRLVFVVVEGKVVEVTVWERRIAGSRDEVDGTAAAAAAAAGDTNDPSSNFARDVHALHWRLIAGAVQRGQAVAGTLCRAHLVE